MNRLKRFIVELHRRSIWQVLGVYCLGSWAAYQVIAEVTDRMGLPDWVPGFAIVLFLIGLPIVIATAIVQEGLPGQSGRAGRRDGLSSETPTIDERALLDPTLLPQAVPAEAERRAPAAGSPARGQPHWFLTWQRALLSGIVAFLLLGVTAGGYMGMRNAGIGPFGSLVGAGVLAEREALVIAEFESRTGDAGLGEVVTEAFRVDFAQSPMITVVEPSYVRQALQRMQRDATARLDAELAREVALREGFKAIVTGEVASAGYGFILTARLVSTADDAVLASFRETAVDSAALLPAIDRLSKQLRERIGESLRTIRRNAPLEQVTTPSLAALQKYSQAERILDSEGDYDKALPLLEEAVALDPEFAMAWRKIGIVLTNQRLDRPRMLAALTRAYEHRDRLTDRERYVAIGTYHDIVTNETASAINAYRTLLDTYPRDRAALNNLGRLHVQLGDLEGAVNWFARTLEADSFSALTYGNLINLQYRLGRTADATRTLDRFAARFPEHVTVLNLRMLFAYAAGDLEEAIALVRQRQEAFRGSLGITAFANLQLGRLHLIRGRLAEAAQHFSNARDADIARRVPHARLGFEIGNARHLLHVLGQPPEQALRGVEAELRRTPLASEGDPAERPYLWLAQLYAEAGQPARAHELLADWERHVPAEVRRDDEGRRRAIIGLIAQAESRLDDAVRELEAARQIDNCGPCALVELGLVHEARDDAAAAIASYEAFLSTPWLGRLGFDADHLGFVLERLGALHDEQGDRDAAARYYARFVELWAGADPVLQPRLESARRRLQQLMEPLR